MVLSGQLAEPDDDVEAEHMQAAERILSRAGYKRYEVASYAKPGFECRHNIAYWTGVPYLGLGRSAASMTQNAERRMRIQDGKVTDDLDAGEMAAEDMMLGMRMSRGISDDLVQRLHSCCRKPLRRSTRSPSRGLCEHVDGRWRPTERGWLCGNQLYGALFDLA